MELLERKIDKFLIEWKQNPDRKPLIVRGARQIGKTESIKAFGRANYESVLEINFVLQKKFRTIFDDGYEVDQIIKNITVLEPSWSRLRHFAQVILSRWALRCDLLRLADGHLLRGNRVECGRLQRGL